MTKRTNVLASLLLITSIFFTSLSAGAVEHITCESEGDHYKTCSLSPPRYLEDAEVWISYQISKTSCIEGVSWGVKRNDVWVKNGCRARFAVDFGRNHEGSYRHESDDWRDRDDEYSDSFRRDRHRDDYYRHDRDERDLRSERERLENERLDLERTRIENERQKLEEERERLKQRPTPDSCPPGARPGRCSDKDRKHGCKDWRTPGGLGCRSN